MRSATYVRGLVVAFCTLVAQNAEAAPAKGERYYIEINAVERRDDQPEMLVAMVQRALEHDIERRDRTLHELPDAAPDREKEPDAFKRFLRKHRLRAFDVRVEITRYARTLEPAPDGASGQRLGVAIALHLFGETIPDRTMAFTGDGSASIQLEIGNKLRERDDEVAHADAIELAVTEAVDQALAKLRQPPPSQQAKRRNKQRTQPKQ
jgi:hypothetical protein